jgi:hypothetical protein
MAIKVVPDIHGVREEFDALKCLRRCLHRPILLGAPGLMDPVSGMNLKKDMNSKQRDWLSSILKGEEWIQGSRERRTGGSKLEELEGCKKIWGSRSCNGQVADAAERAVMQFASLEKRSSQAQPET